MKLRRREAEVFSLSFLDCICCGFGAIIILLLVLTEVDQPVVIERATEAMNGQLLKLQQELFVLRGETDELHRELRGRITQLREQSSRLVRLQADLGTVKGEFATSNSNAQVSNIVENELVAAYQELTRRDGAPAEAAAQTRGAARGGWHSHRQRIRGVHHRHLRQHGEQPLGIHRRDHERGAGYLSAPEGPAGHERPGPLHVRGPARGQVAHRQRRAAPEHQGAVAELDAVQPFRSVPGIELALRQYRAAGQRIGIYVIGDEFTGDSMQRAIGSIAKLNAADGKRPRARIHAIGFPEGAGMPPFTNIQFSALMRLVTAQNGGTFVGITSEKPCLVFTEILGTRHCVGR